MAGCQATRPPPPPAPAFRCEQPALRGATWADIAILSVEQKSAIDICNIRNGVDVYERKSGATRRDTPVPTPVECGVVGVQVAHDRPVTGAIRNEVRLDTGFGHLTCGDTLIGCAVPVSSGVWDIYYENKPWVLVHERCHALYEQGRHTLEYLATRKQ